MNKLEDYYMILQVHYLAEPEVIEGAYKKLAKKYHPDLSRSKNSDEKMQLINRAYEELSDPARRQQYDLKWKSGNGHIEPQVKYQASFTDAKAVLDEYFRNIMDSRFDVSYGLASSIDRQNIPGNDFISWQRAVTSVFHLKEYSCKVHRAYKNKLLNGRVFKEAVEFSVNVVEYNAVMDKEEKDSLIKTVVLENGEWRVFIGYEKLQPLISRFKELTDLLTARSVMNEFIEMYSKVDNSIGLLNRKGITERIESEIYRFNRYKHVFSLIMVQIDTNKANSSGLRQEDYDYMVRSVGEILSVNLRKLDAVGRWAEMTFLVLLPETPGKGAVKAANKLYCKLKSNIFMHNGRPFAEAVKIGTVEYSSSLKDSLDKLNRQVKL